MRYLKKTIKGLFWMAGLRGFTRIVSIVKLGVLARLLNPLEFGLFGIASLVLSLLESLTETGINVFFIQNEGSIKKYVSTAWIFSILRGTTIFFLLLLGSRFISIFFNSPQSNFIIKSIAFVALLRGLINPSEVKFQKDLDFHKEFVLRGSIVLADFLVSVLSTVYTKNALGLVWGMLAGTCVEVFVSFLMIKPRPKLAFDFTKATKVFQRGKWITSAGIFHYLFTNGDNIVVGKLMDTYALGLYQTAYRISTIPITEISDIFGKVTFPIYSKICNNKKLLRDVFIKSLVTTSILVIPIGTLIYVHTKLVVEVLLGRGWIEIVPALKFLSLFGIIRALEAVAPPLFLAVKKQEYVAVLSMVSFLGLAVSIVPFVRNYGYVGAAYSAMFGAVITLPIIIYQLILVLTDKKC